jgi:hypothetical protein
MNSRKSSGFRHREAGDDRCGRRDTFAEVREAEVIAALRRRPRLRDEIYFERI